MSAGSPKNQGVQQVMLGSKEHFMICLTKVGQIFIWGDFSVPVPLDDGYNANESQGNKVIYLLQKCQDQPGCVYRLSGSVPLKQASNIYGNSLDEGTLYAWGDDSDQKHGVLGLGNQYKAVRPCPNSQLFDYMIKQISLAETHGCAVDSSGRLFSWGYGPNGELGLENNQQVNVPTIVSKQKQLNIKKAMAHQNYTVFCSGAGYVYLYGTLQPQLGKIFSTNKGSFGGPQVPIQKSISSGDNLRQSFSGLQKQQQPNNKPLNAMTQIMSLNENFINDMVCGDSFLVCLTSQGDIFFVDDALESVQINTLPIESIAISGSKILGLNGERLYEWSTAGLNKLSFNKENKLLLRQDFQMKEYKLGSKFSSNSILCNMNLQRGIVGLIFEDIANQTQKFKQLQEILTEDDQTPTNIEERQLEIAELIVPNKQSAFNPMITDSSINSSHDQIEVKETDEPNPLQTEEGFDNSFQNEEFTPEISIAHNDFNLADDQVPTFKQYDQRPSIQVDNVENQRPSGQQITNIGGHRKTKAINNQNVFAMSGQNQFFFDMNGSDTVNQQNFAYRPSSIKSFKESNGKSPSYINNSSPSLKQCAEQMMPLGRNSRIEISYPSFIHMSSEQRDQNIISPEPVNLSKQQSASVSKQPLIELIQNDDDEDNVVEERYQFQINFQPCENLNQSERQSNSGSREASIVRTTRKEEDKVEESMEITIDSIQIKAMRTTTPRRLLNSYSQNKRSSIGSKSKSYISSRRSQMNPQQSEVKSQLKSQVNLNQSFQSELSNSFNVTTYSICNKENQKDYNQNFAQPFQSQKQIQQVQLQSQASDDEDGEPQVEIVKKVKYNNKLSNSCEQHNKSKKKSFIQAVLQQSKGQGEPQFHIENNPSSVTQIYMACPLDQDQSKVKKQESSQDQESENELTSFILHSEGKQSEKTQYKEDLPRQQSNSQLYQSQHAYDPQQQFQLSIPAQVINIPRYSHAQAQQQDSFFINRESVGPLTQQQTEDNFEVEYTISQSCTPQSKQDSSHIKRRINFDDASGDGQGGAIRFSETTNTRFLNSFSLNLAQPPKIISQKSFGQNQHQQLGDQSQSFIIHQCQSPMIHPFNEENPVSNIKNSNTPSNQASTTHIMMLTEEKFKNLKTEISQQIDQPYQRMRDSVSSQERASQMKLDQSKSYYNSQPMNISQHHNLSSFIKHSKYFQVFENYRRGFLIVNKLIDLRRGDCLKLIKAQAQIKKQRQEQLQNLVKVLFSVIKGHIQMEKAHGFKRVKKVYKERQLQVFIQRKQNEYVLKTAILVKVDQVLLSHNQQLQSQAFKNILDNNVNYKKQQQEKKRKSVTSIVQVLTKRNKQNLEKSLRNILTWANEKKILDMNMKMTSRILNKMIIKHKRRYFATIKQNLYLLEKQKVIIESIIGQKLKKSFEGFKLRIQQIKTREIKFTKAINICENYNNNLTLRNFFQKWNQQVNDFRKLERLSEICSQLQDYSNKVIGFKVLKQRRDSAKKREVILKMNKATLLFLFKKLDDIRRANLRAGLAAIYQAGYKESSVMQKSNTQTNLSFNFNGNNEMSMIYRSKAVSNYNSESDNLEHYRTHQQMPKSGRSQQKSLNTSYQLKNYQTNSQHPNYQSSSHQSDQFIVNMASDMVKKPKLNDYLSFSPAEIMLTDEQSKQGNSNKFFSRRKTEANTGNTLKNCGLGPGSQRNERSYMDCPIPIKDYQERQQQKRIQQQSLETLPSNLNVSIKDMNRAFRDQVSRIKERQDEQDISSFQHQTDQSSEKQNRLMIDIELTQTPDHLNQETLDNFKSQPNNQKRNRSPTTINPLCTSESYCMLKGFMSNQSVVQADKLKSGQNYASNNLHSESIVGQGDIRLDHNMMTEFNQDYHTAPKTSTFGGLHHIGIGSENIDGDSSDDKKNKRFQKTTNIPAIFKINDLGDQEMSPHDTSAKQGFSQTMNRKKSDLRYQLLEQHLVDQEYALEFEQEKDMFDEFLNNEAPSALSRGQSASNIQIQSQKSQYIDRKVNLSQSSKLNSQHDMPDQEHLPHQVNHKNMMQISQSSYQSKQQQVQSYREQKQMKQLLISPNYTDESFIPQALNRELLNEMAAAYQMMELTPDADSRLEGVRKSLFHRQEESICSNQYADPMEMAVSPRATIADVSSINHQTGHTQENYYTLTQETHEPVQHQTSSECEDEYGEEIDQIIQRRESEPRPYDFELSSHSKYKIISQDNDAQKVLQTIPAQPSKMQVSASATNICKKLSFGYDLNKKRQEGNNKQRSTLFVNSNGEQTINFNLTQEDDPDVDNINRVLEEDSFEEEDSNMYQTHSDEELEVGEEKSAEVTQKMARGLPESRILQQELQQEKLNMTLSSQDLIMITQNRLQKMSNNIQNTTGSEYTFQQHRSSTQSDFIQQNIQKLRNIVRLSPRYYENQNQQQYTSQPTQGNDILSRLSSTNQSTRNFNTKTRANGLFSAKTNTHSSYEQPLLNTQNLPSQLSANQPNHPTVYKSFAFSNTTNMMQQMERQSKPGQYTQGNMSQRSFSKENTKPMSGVQQVRTNQHPKPSNSYSSQNQQTLRDKSNNLRRSGTSYQPLTFRAPSTGAQNHSQGSFGGPNYSANISGVMNPSMFERRVSYQEQFENTNPQPLFRNTSNSGSFSQRGATQGANYSFSKSRNTQNDKLQTFLQMGSKVMTNVSAAQMNSSLVHNQSLRHQ